MYYQLQGQLHLKSSPPNDAEAAAALNHALKLDHQNADARALLGLALYESDPCVLRVARCWGLTGFAVAAQHAFEHALSQLQETRHRFTCMSRLGALYLQAENFSAAKEMFLQSCAARPSAITWLGVGIASYRLGELTEAEQALAEANIFDSNEPEVWAYLALICTRLRRRLEAEQAVKFAVKLGLDNDALKEEMKLELLESGYAATFEDFAAVFA